MFATKQDYSDFTGIPLADLPSNIEFLLDAASDLIDGMVLSYDNTDTEHVDALKKATCVQTHYIESIGGNENLLNFDSISIGSFSLSNVSDSGRGKDPTFSKRAKSILFKAGLLYRGVK